MLNLWALCGIITIKLEIIKLSKERGVRKMNLSGLKLYELRASYGLTLKGLGELAGLSDNTINAMEKSRKKARLRSWYKVARALNIPLETLLEDEQANSTQSLED